MVAQALVGLVRLGGLARGKERGFLLFYFLQEYKLEEGSKTRGGRLARLLEKRRKGRGALVESGRCGDERGSAKAAATRPWYGAKFKEKRLNNVVVTAFTLLKWMGHEDGWWWWCGCARSGLHVGPRFQKEKGREID
jgi:hypothetical protein